MKFAILLIFFGIMSIKLGYFEIYKSFEISLRFLDCLKNLGVQNGYFNYYFISPFFRLVELSYQKWRKSLSAHKLNQLN